MMTVKAVLVIEYDVEDGHENQALFPDAMRALSEALPLVAYAKVRQIHGAIYESADAVLAALYAPDPQPRTPDAETAQAIHEAHTTMTYSLADIANGDTGNLDPKECPVCYGAEGRLGPAAPPEHNHSTLRERCTPGCPSYHATISTATDPTADLAAARSALARVEALCNEWWETYPAGSIQRTDARRLRAALALSPAEPGSPT